MGLSEMSSNQHNFTRRDLLQVGSLSLLGLTTADLARLRAASNSDAANAKHRRNSCVFIFLFGGPSHIDLWDMKPGAPAEVRGEFQPVNTKVPGIDLCEHLPLMAGQMDKFCLVRSMNHKMNVHGPACSEMITGREYPFPPTTDQARPEDWPSLSSLAMRYAKSYAGLPSSIVLPWYLQFPGQGKLIAGQTGGRMGRHHSAMLVEGDPSQPDFESQGFQLADDVTPNRLVQRRKLLNQIEKLHNPKLFNDESVKMLGSNYKRAFSLLESRSREAFSMKAEPQKLRDQYGDSKIAQSFLLSRRLVEAGASLVTVNWEDPTKISGTNTCWDTHKQNFPKLKTLLCPMFDKCFSTFLKDLDDRGLLETTLVVVTGEFGRTPKMGQFTQSNNTVKSGRDHWPHAFTVLLAGGGVRGGQAYGTTTRNGGYVLDQPVTPSDLTATILHHLGVDATGHYFDEFQNINRRISEGTPIRNLG